MIYTLLKSSVVNIEPKQLNYRDFKNFSFEIFKEDLSEALAECTNSYETFEDAFKTSLDKYAPKKKKWLRRNSKPHVNKMLRKAIMKRSKLKNKANKTKLPVDINNYKKQRNYVANLNKRAKLNSNILIDMTVKMASLFGLLVNLIFQINIVRLLMT